MKKLTKEDVEKEKNKLMDNRVTLADLEERIKRYIDIYEGDTELDIHDNNFYVLLEGNQRAFLCKENETKGGIERIGE